MANYRWSPWLVKKTARGKDPQAVINKRPGRTLRKARRFDRKIRKGKSRMKLMARAHKRGRLGGK